MAAVDDVRAAKSRIREGVAVRNFMKANQQAGLTTAADAGDRLTGWTTQSPIPISEVRAGAPVSFVAAEDLEAPVEEVAEVEGDGLDEMTLTDLRKWASDLEIEGRSGMDKGALIEAIRETYVDEEEPEEEPEE